MNTPDLSTELSFRTARSGGKGGQNVNKLETMVEALWQPKSSSLFSEEEKRRIVEKLASRINKGGYLQVRSSESRTQGENKAIAQRKLEELVAKALVRPKPRKASRPTRSSIEARLDNKRRAAFKKQLRRKDW
ncbi:MAG: aminoacyl-tRNA hydrolase [Bacteroidetes bacterium]|nr:aminoacyl-tRNA hydrolase [Bacteroidota bacterium]MBS1630127.1 aminoacyl-tRNA hydrolase [Bacteroidota bacterium]